MRWNEDQAGRHQRNYLERATDEVRAWFGDDAAAQRREADLAALGRGEGRYPGTFDRADPHGFGPARQRSYEWWRSPGPYAGRGPQGYQRSDARIAEEINERLTQHGRIDARQIQVSVASGIVTLSGAVSSRAEKHMAEDVAESCAGVSEVQNRIRVTR
ncbi:MAG: BON domain-containing protein [Blastocatellia bacterium]